MRKKHLALSSAAIVAAALLGQPVHAQTSSGWTGVNSASWSLAGNWDNGAPSSGNVVNLFFGNAFDSAGAAGSLTANNDLVGYNGWRITFEDTALPADPAFVIAGSAFTLFDFGGQFPKIENFSNATQTFTNTGITLTGGGTGKAEINPVNGDIIFSAATPVTLNSPLDIFGANGKTLTFDGVVSGAAANPISLKQNSTLVLNAANTYDGATNIQGGVVVISASNNLGSGAVSNTISIDAGTLRTTNSAALDLGAARALAIGAAGATLQTNGTADVTLSGVVSGAGNLTKTGNGTLVLGGTNIYTGKTVLSGGTLAISTDANLGTAPGAAVADQFRFVGGTLKLNAGISFAANRGFNVSSGANFIDGNGFTSTINSATSIAGSGTSLSFVTSSGTATTFTIAASGTNATSGSFAIGPNVTVNLGNNGSVGNLAGNTVPITIAAGGTLRFNRNNGTSYNSDILGEGQVNVANNTGQAVTLNPTTSNTYEGGTLIGGSNAIVLGTKDTAFGTGPINFTASAGTVASNNATARNFGNDVFLKGSAAGTAVFGQTTTGTGLLTFSSLNLDRVATAITRTVTTNVATTFGALNNGVAGAVPSNLSMNGSQTRIFNGNGSFSGTMTWNSGAINVVGPNGALASATTITQGDNGGADETAVFGSPLAGGLGDVVTLPGGLDRIGDTSAYRFNGTGAFTYNGAAAGSTGTTETIGSVDILVGRAHITLNPSSDAPLQLVANTLTRPAATALVVRGNGLGGLGNGESSFVLGNAPSLLVGGGGAAGSKNISILPFAVGDASSTGGGSGFMTHDAGTGLRLLAAGEYDSAIAGLGALRNVSTAVGETVASDVTLNSLRLTGGSTSIAANTRLRVPTVLLAGAATLDGPGLLEFGASEGIITVASGSTVTGTVASRISGTGGVTFSGSNSAAGTNQVLLLSGDNVATGTYIVNTGVTLRLGSSTALNDNIPVTATLRPASVLQLNGNDAVLRNFALSSFSGTVQNNSTSPVTLTAYQLAANSFAGGTFINDGGTGKLNLVFHGNSANTTTLNNTSGNYSYTGTTEVRTGTLTLSGSGVGILNGTAGVIVNGGTFRLTNNANNSTTRVNDAATVTMNGGTFDFDNNANSGTNFSETIGALTVNSGTNVITMDKSSSTSASTLTFASLARNPGAWLLFNSQNNGTAIYDLGASNQSRLVFTANPPLDDGLIGGWAVIDTASGVRNFATYSGTSVTNLTGQAATLSTGANPSQNVAITASATLTGDTQINSLAITPAAAATVALGGGTLRVESGGVIVQGGQNTTFSGGTLTAGTGANAAGELIFHVSGAATATIAAPIADNGAGAVSISKNSTGTLDLTGAANSYSGKTYLNGGTVRIAADSAFGAAPSAFTADSLTLTGGVTVDTTPAPASFTLNANRGIVVGPNPSGGGTNVISIASGTAGNGRTITYNGSITPLGTTEGSLHLKTNAVATTGVDPGKFNAALSALSLNGTFRLDTGAVTVAAGSHKIGRSLQVGMDGTGSLAYAGGSLTVGAGLPTDVLEVGVNASNILATSGTLDVSALSQFTANVETIRIGHASSNFTGRGSLLLPNNSEITAGTSFTVGTTANSGNAGVTSLVAFGNGMSTVTTKTFTMGGTKSKADATVAPGGTVKLSGFSANALDFSIGLYGDTGTTGSTSTFNMTGGTMLASLNNLVIGQKTGGNNGGIQGVLTVTGNDNAISANAITLGRVDGNSAASTNATAGTINFGGGSLVVNNNVSLGLWSNNGAFLPTATGTLNITGGSVSIGANIVTTDSTQANAIVTLDGGSLDMTGGTVSADTFNARAGKLSHVAQIFTGDGVTPAALVKTTGGILELAGTLEFTGATQVQAGTLHVTGALTNSAVNVISGTLSGTGSITGAVTVGDDSGVVDAVLSPGASIGTLSAGAVTFGTDAAFNLEINTANLTSDLLASSGSVVLGLGIVPLNASDFGFAPVTNGEVFTFITALGGVSGTFAGLPDGTELSIGPNTFTIDYEANSVSLVAVPEPSAMVSLLGGLAALLGFRRRR